MVPKYPSPALPYEFAYQMPTDPTLRHHRFQNGGLLETTHLGRPPKYVHLTMKTSGVDQIPCMLQQGELVVPKKHVDKVVAFLKTKNIRLPNT